MIRARTSVTESLGMRCLLVLLGLAFVGLFLVLPLLIVFVEAFRGGWEVYLQSFKDEAALAAITLTLKIAVIAVVVNTLFGLFAAWAIAKFSFPGKRFLISLIDVPFSVSPVIAGLVFVLLFGAAGWFAPLLKESHLQIIFALPGMVLATIFVTLPFVAKELIPLMEEQGTEEEEAAVLLGASGWQMFRKITLPNIKWALLYGVLLTNARAMGEFGAVSVVSGHIRGETTTIPLMVEILYNEYQFSAAFALASLLSMLGFLTLLLKSFIEWKMTRGIKERMA